MLATLRRDITSFKATTLTNSGRLAHYVVLLDSKLCLVMAVVNRHLSHPRFIQSSAENKPEGEV